MKKHWQYALYVVKHRWFVLVECCRLRVPWLGLTHDLSKFLPDEWFPYASYFYGKKLAEGYMHEPGADDEFDRAWLRHQHRNPHHWQYWRLRQDDGGTKCLAMPEKYVREMLADWRGAGRAQGFSKLGAWYERNRSKIELHRETRARLHSLMNLDELPRNEPIEIMEGSAITRVVVGDDGLVTIEAPEKRS